MFEQKRVVKKKNDIWDDIVYRDRFEKDYKDYTFYELEELVDEQIGYCKSCDIVIKRDSTEGKFAYKHKVNHKAALIRYIDAIREIIEELEKVIEKGEEYINNDI